LGNARTGKVIDIGEATREQHSPLLVDYGRADEAVRIRLKRGIEVARTG
jgi:hypothetical protein